MATSTKKSPEEIAADRWQQGTEHFLEKFAPVAKEIHEEAKRMPHGGRENAKAIVAMTISRLRKFSDEYHAEEDEE